METEFKREDRYIVIKRKDLSAAPFAALHSFLEHLQALEGLLPARQFVVIESDWPEYEAAWRMIERRVAGQSALSGEPEYPAGAIHNGRAFIDQLESIYAFKEQQGHPLSLCSEWQELVRCFEFMAESIDDHRAQFARLQAEVERLTTENGKIRAINNLLDGINERAHDQIRRMVGRLQSAKLNPDCAICSSLGDICVTCEEPTIQAPDTKLCAAKYGPHECSAARAEDSLFCAQHRSVDGRQRMGSEPITNEGLAFMMQRDGEIQ